MSSRREPPAGPSHSRPPSPFPRRPSVSTHQPPPSTPQFGRDPPLLCNPPPARSTDPSRVVEREFPRDAPKGPKALCNQPSSASGPGGGSAGGSAAHSPHKSSFSGSAASPHHGHGHHYPQAGANSASRGSQPPPGPRGGVGRGAPLLSSANQIRSPVSTPGGAGISTSGGQMFGSGYATAGETNIYRARRRSGEWEPGRGGGRSREREYDYGPRGGGGFGSNFRDRDDRSREFREPRGGYRGRSRDREMFPHRARSTSRERDRERNPSYPGGGGGRDRLDRGGMNFPGDRRSVFDRDEREPERERERQRLRVERERRERGETERERERERQRDRERERERDREHDRSIGDRERFGGGDRRMSMSIERERERGAERPRGEGSYDPGRGDRERERRERDAVEYNRSRDAERARFSSATQSHQVPALASPPPSSSYHGNYQLANSSGGATTFGSAAQQPPGRPAFQHPPAVGSQWPAPAPRRTTSGGTTGALPQTTYRDRDKDPHRDVSQKIDYRLDTRSSDRAPPLKKEPTDDISPLTQDSKSANTPLSALPSTGATPISATSSRPYSPPPAQAPSGPRSGTGANPPTGPRGGPPPTGPRHGVDRKDAERKWGSKDRGGSAEYWNTQTSAQSHQTSLNKQSAQPPAGRLEIGGNLHPDRKREIEKVNDDRDNKHHAQQASISSEFSTSQESAESSGTAEPAGMEHGSWAAIPPTRTSGAAPNVTPLAPSRSGSSGQGFRGSQNSPNAPTFGPSGAGPLTPTAPAGPSGSPTGGPPPTAPRAILKPSRNPYRSRRGGGGGYRPQGGFGASALKRENDTGYWGANRGMGGADGGMGRGSMDRGRRGSRSGPEPDRLAAKEGLGDVEMLDARSKDERREDIATTLERSSQAQENAESHTEKTIQSSPPPPVPIPAVPQPPPVVKIEEEDEDDVSLTQADVISKIADIDGDIRDLEQKLEELDRARVYHQEKLDKIEEEELQAKNAVPPAEEVSVAVEFPEPEKMDYDLPEETSEVEQLQSQAQQERQERASNGEQPSEQLNSEPKPVEEDILDLPDRPRTPTASPSSTPSPMRSRTPSDADSIETESDELIKHLMISAHPDLPFYRPGPPLKPADYGFFHSNLQQHEGIRELVVAQISTQKQATFEMETRLKRKYCEYYEPWHERCLELEKESSRKKKSNSEPADTNGTSPAVTASTAAETPTAVGRRAARAGDVVRSEAELEQVIKNLAEQDEQKADSGSKPPGVKEAYVPAMILDPRERLIFQDTNRLLQSDDDIKRAFHYDVSPDDWTEPEQKLFCDRYMQFPKQWGKIAQGIQGRDFKACILHYYMTKKAQGYKELQKGGGKRGRGKRRKAANPQKTRQSALIADLGRRGGEEEDADSEDVMPTAMTDSGRPKRAAAPVFGGESNNNQDPEAPGKRGGKGDDDESRTGGTKRTRGNNNVGRERGQKRVRAPATPAVQPTPPPNVPVSQPALAPVLDKVDGNEKEEKKEDLGDRETDAVHVLTGLSGIAEPLPTPPLAALQPVQPVSTPSVVIEDKKPITIPTTPTISYAAPSDVSVVVPIPPSPQPLASPVEPSLTQVTIKKEKIDRGGGGGVERPVAQTSSYWSVPEQNDFPQLLAAYGTNWAAIASRLASKTTVMVRNFYQRQVDNGKSEFKQIAEDAERKIRAGETMPEPPKPATLPKKRYGDQVGGPQRMLPQDPPQTLAANQFSLPSQPVLLQPGQPVRLVINVEDDGPPIKQQPAYSSPPPPVSAPSLQHQFQEIRQLPQRQMPGMRNPMLQLNRQQQQEQREQQQREQRQREQQQREQQQREQQQREQQQREQQREQQQREQQREQQQREQQQREQQQREQQQRDKQQREQREQQQREQQQREQQQREQQQREQQQREQRERENHQQPQRPQQQHPHQQHPQQHPQQERSQPILQQHHLQQPPLSQVVVPPHSHPRAPPPPPQPPQQVQLLVAPIPTQPRGVFIQQTEEIHSGRPERRLEKQSERGHDRTHSAQLERPVAALVRRQMEVPAERPMDSRHSERQSGGPGKHLERPHVGGSQVGPREVAKPLGAGYERPRDAALERQRDGVGASEGQAVSGQPPGGSLIGRSHGVPQGGMQERLEKPLQDRSLERSHEGLRTPHERHMNREIPSAPPQAPPPSPHTPVSNTPAPQGKIISPQVPIPKQQGRGPYHQQHQPNQSLHHRNLSSPSTISTFDPQYPQQPFSQHPRVPLAEKPQPSRAPEPLVPPSSRPMSAPSSGQLINQPYQPPPPSHLSSALQIQRQPSLSQAPAHAPPPPLPPAQSHPSTPAAPSKPRPTSIHSLLNPAKEEPPSRPQSRPTLHHLPPQTPPQQPPPHAPPPQHASSQLTTTQHVTQHLAQHPSQHSHHSSLQHLQHPQHVPHSHHSQHSGHHPHQQHSQSSSIHAPMPRESSRRDVAPYDLPHESHQQLPLMAKNALSRGGPPPYDSVQPPRGPSSYSTPPREQPYNIPPRESSYTPALRETPYSTPPPPHTQSRQGLSGSHTPTTHSTLQPSNYPQGHHSHYSSRPQTCSPYRPGGPPSGPQSGPYPPPPSMPPSQPPHHPHYGQPPPPQQHPGNCHTPPPPGQYRTYYDGHERGRQY